MALLKGIDMSMEPFFDETARKGVRVLGSLGLVALATDADGALITQTDVNGDMNVQYDTTPAVNDFNLLASLVNDNAGTEYESGLTSVFDSASDSLFNTARNQSLYSTKEGFIAGEGITVSLEAGGEKIDRGWSATPNSDFSEISLAHTFGDPGFDYEPWLTGTTPVTLWLNGNLDALKSNDDANPWEASTDNQFNFVGLEQNAFTASDVGGTPYTAYGQSYGVIPEPAVSGLMIMAAIGAMAYKRLVRKS